jgi:L-iditol 2-dehydrogenase
VVGAGVIGLFLVQALRAAGCGRIIAADLDQKKLDLACKLGADEGFRPDQTDVAAEVMRRTGGRGADVSLEAVGIAPTVQVAAACLRKGGQLTLVGLLASKVELPMQTIVTRELTINSSYISCGEYPACLDLIARGTINVEPLISAVAPLVDGPAWFQRLHDGTEGLIKVILEP